MLVLLLLWVFFTENEPRHKVAKSYCSYDSHKYCAWFSERSLNCICWSWSKINVHCVVIDCWRFAYKHTNTWFSNPEPRFHDYGGVWLCLCLVFHSDKPSRKDCNIDQFWQSHHHRWFDHNLLFIATSRHKNNWLPCRKQFLYRSPLPDLIP